MGTSNVAHPTGRRPAGSNGMTRLRASVGLCCLVVWSQGSNARCRMLPKKADDSAGQHVAYAHAVRSHGRPAVSQHGSPFPEELRLLRRRCAELRRHPFSSGPTLRCANNACVCICLAYFRAGPSARPHAAFPRRHRWSSELAVVPSRETPQAQSRRAVTWEVCHKRA